MQKLLKQSKGMLLIYLILLCTMAALIFLYCARSNELLSRNDKNTQVLDSGMPSRPLDAQPGGTVVRQEIQVTGELLDLSVLMAAHDRKNAGSITIRLFDKETLLASKTIAQKLVREKTYTKLILPEPYISSKPTLLTMEIVTEGSGEADSVTPFLTENGSGYAAGSLTVNGAPYDADLCFSYTLVQRKIPLSAGLLGYCAAFVLLVSATYWLFWGKRFYALLVQVCLSIKRAPLQWLANTGLLLGAAGLGLLTEFLYARIWGIGLTSLGTALNPARLAFFAAAWVLAAVFYLLRKQVQEKPEKLFAFTILILGCLFICLIPTANFISWDEPSHFYWSLSQSYPDHVYMTTIDIVLWQDPPLPVSWDLAGNKAVVEEMNKVYEVGYTGHVDNAGIDRFLTFIGHWPAGLAMALARALGLSFQWIFLFGKLGNLAAYTAILYFAIRKLRSGKMLLAAIACMPTPFFLATVYSYDFWVTAWAMFAFATYFSQLQQPEKKMTFMTAFVMLGAMLLACLPKQPYIPLLLPFLFLSRSKFATRKQHRAYVLSVIAVALLIAASFLMVRMGTVGDGDFRGGETVSVSGQIQYILTDPAGFMKTIFGFIREYLSFSGMGGVLSIFAYLGLSKSASYAACLLLLISVTDKADSDQFALKARTRLFTWSACLITVFALAVSLYIAFTPVGLNTVNGCQPRYLLPLIFPALFLIGSPRIVNHMDRRLYYYMGHGCMAFILLQSIWDMVATQLF